MSDTPRTDSLLTAILDLDGYVAHRNCPPTWVSHARELERELNAVTSEVERLRKANLQLREGAEEQKQRIKRLEQELMEVKNKHSVLVADVVLYDDRAERIKRLEEAGDKAILNSYLPDRIAMWRKAKEAKP